jgi:hypothetical protein
LLAHERFYGQVWDAFRRDTGIAMSCCSHKIATFCTSYDFLLYDCNMPNVITEPPVSMIEAYAERALSICTGKVAFLVPVVALTSVAFKEFVAKCGVTRVYMLSKKPAHQKSPMAWVVWEKGNWEAPVIRFV